MKFTLKKDLLLGVATASAQIEGGDRNHNWARFSEEGKIADGSSILRADDQHERIYQRLRDRPFAADFLDARLKRQIRRQPPAMVRILAEGCPCHHILCRRQRQRRAVDHQRQRAARFE